MKTLLGDRLRNLRLVRGWDQAQLAQKSGVARATIQRIEYGYCDPRIATARQLVRALGIDFNELLEDTI